jgi:hypothetical protein
MGTHSTSDEVKAAIINSFPSGTGEIFYELWRNMVHLHMNWKNYRTLYGTSAERIDLLKWAASVFFGLLNGILWHDIILSIARLTDPAQSSRKCNASLAYLRERLASFMDTPSLDTLNSKLQDIQSYCDPIRQIRNRLLAHDDLATALNYHSDPLPSISRAYIEDALERLRDFLGDIEEYFCGSRTHHLHVIFNHDGEDLISKLEDALEHEKCRDRELKQKYGIEPTEK